jgi:hypothetical protein
MSQNSQRSSQNIPYYVQRPGATRFPAGSPQAKENKDRLTAMQLRRKNNSSFAQSVDLALRAAQRWRAQGLGRCPNWEALIEKALLRGAVEKSVGVGCIVHAVPPGRRDALY